jgi:hypothetical protein
VLLGKQNQRLIDESSPRIPADYLRDFLKRLIIPCSLEKLAASSAKRPQQFSEYASISPGDHRKIGSKDNFRVTDHPPRIWLANLRPFLETRIH